jgi:DNA-binding SARP family transcriptional activator
VRADHPKFDVNESLVLDLQVLGRVVVAEERNSPPGRALLRYITVRQADYVTRRILNGQLLGWADEAEARKAVHRNLMKLKALVDGDAANENDCFHFADKVTHDVEWADHVRMAAGMGKQSVA